MADLADYAAARDDAFSALAYDLLWGIERPALPTAVDHAYEIIWRQLLDGRHTEGARLADTELAAHLGLSRTPVRQALHRLEREGLVRFDPRRGFSVRVFQAQDVEEIYTMRGALEVLALRLAAPHLGREEVEAHLEALYRLRAHWQECPVALLLQSDIRLHNLLIHRSGNRLLIRTLAELRSQVSMFQYRDTSFPHRNRIALDDHERILLALLAGKTELAADYMAQHIVNAKDGVVADFFDVHP